MSLDTKSKADFVAAFSDEFREQQQFSSPYRIVPDAKVADRLIKLSAHEKYDTPPFEFFATNQPAFHLSGSNTAVADLDKCFDAKTGRMKKWAVKFINKYVLLTAHEFSCSRTGSHFYFALEDGIPAEKIVTKSPEGAVETGHIDLFVNKGWVAMTGIPLMNSPHPELLKLDKEGFEALKRELQESGRFVQPISSVSAPRTESSTTNLTAAQVAVRILGRDLSNNTEEANRLLSQSMGFEHRHQADEKFAIFLVRDSGFGSDQRRAKFEKFKLHEDRSGQYTVKTLENAEKFVAAKQPKPIRKLFLNSGSMATVENKQLRWVKRHILLAAALNLFVGDPGMGKTLAAIVLMAELSRAGKKIVIICREDDYSSMWKPRLVVAEANLENIIAVRDISVVGSEEKIDWMLDDQQHLELLEQKIVAHDATLCVIDPLASFAGRLNLNDGGDVRKITTALDGVARRTEAAVLINCHTTKALVDSAVRTAAGSFQLMAAVQVSWLFIPDPDVRQQCLMLQGRNKSGKKRGFKYRIDPIPWPSSQCGPEDLEPGDESDGVGLFVFKGATDVDANDILQRRLEQGESEIGRVRRWILEFLAKGPVATDTCWKAARAMEFNSDAVNKACGQLTVTRNRTTWALPDVKKPVQKEKTQLDLGGESCQK